MELQQERDEVSAKYVTWITVAVVVVTALLVLLAWWLTNWWQGPATGEPEASVPTKMPKGGHHMESSLIEEEAVGLEFRERQRRQLHAYGWVNRDAGLIHIPIDAAMELYLERQASIRSSPSRRSDGETRGTGGQP